MFYSKSTGGFYSRDIHGLSIPKDAVEITDEQHIALLAGQSQGKRIISDATGTPELKDPESVSLPVVIEGAKARVRAARVAVFATLAGIQSQALADGDTANAQAISTIQTQLADLPGIDLSACENAKDVEEAFALAWATIAATAPAKVAKAFNQVLAHDVAGLAAGDLCGPTDGPFFRLLHRGAIRARAMARLVAAAARPALPGGAAGALRLRGCGGLGDRRAGQLDRAVPLPVGVA